MKDREIIQVIQKDLPLLLNQREACEYLGIKKPTLFLEFVRKYKVKGIQAGRQIKYSRLSICEAVLEHSNPIY